MANNSSRSQNFGGSNQERGPRPYDFVYFIEKPPTSNSPPGHDKYLPDHLHGTLFLTLKVKFLVKEQQRIEPGKEGISTELSKLITYLDSKIKQQKVQKM